VSAVTAIAVSCMRPVGAQAPPPRRVPSGSPSLTVADIIGLSTFASVGQVSVPSFDGAHIAIVVSHGDAARNLVVSSLLVFSRDGLLTTPRADTVLAFGSASNRPPISRMRWLADNRTLAFLGERGDEGDTLPQVYTVDIRTRQLTRRTYHPTVVTAFDMLPGGDPVIYTAVPP